VRQCTSQFIVFLGTDGSGKSSVINDVCDGLDKEGYETHKFHLRPSFRENSEKIQAPVDDPHGKHPYGRWVSTIKVFYLLLYYWGGHFFKVRPLLKRNAVVIFDRYYHDMLVDPKRYCYGGSMRLAHLVGKLIPKPGLWVLLDAPPEVLQNRKQEVPFEETVRQRNEYLKLFKKMKNGIVVDSSRCIADVIADVNIAILNFKTERVEKSLAQ
jgi:thymidylate kinase